jgi:tryptophan synthase alpha chain
VLMGYVNPILRYGPRAFCRDAAASGADGLILPDLPPEEADMIEDGASEAGLALVFLVAPNTSDGRIRLIDERATGFVYAVSVTGVTGAEISSRDAVLSYLRRTRASMRNNPLLVGFGIRTPADVAELCTECDGCIVGSALIRLVADLWKRSDLDLDGRLEQVSRFARSLKEATLKTPA